MNPDNWLKLKRVVRFGDTDAAGVIHFYQLLRWCHESWEESLELYGLSLDHIFPNLNRVENHVSVFLPIVHCEAHFWESIQTGDHLLVEVVPKRLDVGSFQVQTKFKREKKDVALGKIKHRSINGQSRRPCSLPDDIDRWLEASSLNFGITSV